MKEEQYKKNRKKKTWNKEDNLNLKIEKFTVGKDRFYDLFIAKYDIKATIAHAKMLHSIKVLTHSELDKIISELNLINNDIKIGKFIIEDNYEDVHSKIESILVKKLGIIGKKIHTGRSRNDQVVTDFKLWLIKSTKEIIKNLEKLNKVIILNAEKHVETIMTAFTHFKNAKPVS